MKIYSSFIGPDGNPPKYPSSGERVNWEMSMSSGTSGWFTGTGRWGGSQTHREEQRKLDSKGYIPWEPIDMTLWKGPHGRAADRSVVAGDNGVGGEALTTGGSKSSLFGG